MSGYLDGEPVTTGMGIRTGSTIGVYNIATLPYARGRGYGGAMTSRVARMVARPAATSLDPPGESDGLLPSTSDSAISTVVEYMGYVEPRDQ